jgi:hypothetical protein
VHQARTGGRRSCAAQEVLKQSKPLGRVFAERVIALQQEVELVPGPRNRLKVLPLTAVMTI